MGKKNSIDLNVYLEENTKAYKQEKYSMSIREFISMYSDNNINVSPVYQRVFRWKGDKVSRLIESILLGIPLPPIFVSVKDGKWDIVDGVQRISSILWFCGMLNEVGKKGYLKLQNLEILEEFNGVTYEELKKDYSNLLFKYFYSKRIDVNLLISNDIESEYELFNRLNTGGLKLSPQEMRNFLLIKLDEKLYRQLREFSNTDLAHSVLTVSGKQISEDYVMELLVYFLVIVNSDSYLQYKNQKGLEFYKENSKKYLLSRDKFIDVCISEILQNSNTIKDIDYIKNTFKKIHNEISEKPFAQMRKFSPFLYICTISYMHNFSKNKTSLSQIIKKIQEDPKYLKMADRGANVVSQFIAGIEIGRGLL